MAFVSQLTCAYGIPFFYKIITKKDPPCYSCPDYVKELIVYKKKHDFIRYDKNHLQWKNYASVQRLFWAMRNSGARKMKVIHFGDSHVQADIFTHEIRQRMMAGFGIGGRGLVFPYNAAKTHPGADYITSYTGRWENTKNVNWVKKHDLGLSGVTIHTTDKTASFTIKFFANNYNRKNTVLKIYRKYSDQSFDLKVQTRQHNLPVFVPNYADSGKTYVSVPIPENTDYVTVYVKQSNPKQTFFECHGLSFESEEEGGVVYSAVGINGAGLNSILAQNLMDDQIKEMQPDLMVIDLGGNDWYGGNMNEADYQFKMESIIKRFRNAAPEASIIIGTSQDIHHLGVSLTECIKAAEIAKKVAFENDCAFYDYYTVAGGRYSMLHWLKAGLAQYDRVHLNNPGYYLRGELFYNAILNSYYDVLLKGHVDHSEYQMVVMPDKEPVSSAPVPAKTVTPTSTDKNQNLTDHTVKYGEYLSLIAKKYGTDVQTIIKDNQLVSTYLRTGQVLKVRNNSKPTSTNVAVAKVQPNKTNPPQTIVKTVPVAQKKNVTQSSQTKTTYRSKAEALNKGNAVYHTIKYGDNLWDLSIKYKTTVQKIKDLNPSKVNKLVPGQVIRIK